MIVVVERIVLKKFVCNGSSFLKKLPLAYNESLVAFVNRCLLVIIGISLAFVYTRRFLSKHVDQTQVVLVLGPRW